MCKCLIIAGPNGAEKTTFAREYLLKHADIARFINADLIATGLSPLRPRLAARAAGRLFLQELDRHAGERADFAVESTLSGLSYVSRLQRWREAGYEIGIIYLRLQSPVLALKRVSARVRQGGHDVPKADILRRFERSWRNFTTIYRDLAARWEVYDNSGSSPRLIETGP